MTTLKHQDDVHSQPLPPEDQSLMLRLLKWMREPARFTWQNLKEEFEALSPSEQVDIEDEQQGLLEEIDETPGFVSDSLDAMENALEYIHGKEAYEMAMFVIPEYVQDDNFRLAFLRAERFNATAAAQRMVKYWERKVELFGADVAFKSFGSSILDLSKEDLETFINGGIQVLPERDEFGRTIIFMLLSNFGNKVDSILRYHWIILHMAIFDPIGGEFNQKNGLALTITPGTPHPDVGPLLFHERQRLFATFTKDVTTAIPMRPVGCHIFVPYENSHLLLRLTEKYLYGLGSVIRMRLNIYILSHDKNEEVYSRLKEYGMGPSVLPKILGGHLQFNYQKWVRQKVHNMVWRHRVEIEKDKDQYYRNIASLLELLSHNSDNKNEQEDLDTMLRTMPLNGDVVDMMDEDTNSD